MRAVDVDCNREDSPPGGAHTRSINRKGGFTRIPRIYTKGKRSQSKTWSQKDVGWEFYTNCTNLHEPRLLQGPTRQKWLIGNLFSQQFPPVGLISANSCNSCKAAFLSDFLDPIFLTQDVFPAPIRANSFNSCNARFPVFPVFAFSAAKSSVGAISLTQFTHTSTY